MHLWCTLRCRIGCLPASLSESLVWLTNNSAILLRGHHIHLANCSESRPSQPASAFLSVITGCQQSGLSSYVFEAPHVTRVCLGGPHPFPSPTSHCWGLDSQGHRSCLLPPGLHEKHHHWWGETWQAIMETAHFQDPWGNRKHPDKKTKNKKQKHTAPSLLVWTTGHLTFQEITERVS